MESGSQGTAVEGKAFQRRPRKGAAETAEQAKASQETVDNSCSQARPPASTPWRPSSPSKGPATNRGMRGAFQAHHIGWALLVCLTLYGLYSYIGAEWGQHLRQRHGHLPPLQLLTGPGPQGQQQRAATAHPLSVCDPSVSSAAMASGFREQYSIWAQPRGRLLEQLKGEIGHLAQRHSGPAFPPHVTVLGDIEGPREEVVEMMRDLAARVQKYRINFVNVTRGSMFYQCVYLLVAKDEGTMAAAAAARSVFGMTTPPYMPHLSLLYADLPDEERARVVEYETARLYGESSGYDTLMVETGYEVGSFALWYTPTADRSCQSWCLVGEFPLS